MKSYAKINVFLKIIGTRGGYHEILSRFILVDEILPLNLDEICAQMAKLSGEIEFIPPKFSAKRIDGVRAYKMAARGEEFEIKPAKMQVFNTQILSYTHPFLTIEISLSEGG